MQRHFFLFSIQRKIPAPSSRAARRVHRLGFLFSTTLVQTTYSLPCIDEERQAKNNYTTRIEYSTNWQHLQRSRIDHGRNFTPNKEMMFPSLLFFSHIGREVGSKLDISYPKRKGKERKGNGRQRESAAKRLKCTGRGRLRAVPALFCRTSHSTKGNEFSVRRQNSLQIDK